MKSKKQKAWKERSNCSSSYCHKQLKRWLWFVFASFPSSGCLRSKVVTSFFPLSPFFSFFLLPYPFLKCFKVLFLRVKLYIRSKGLKKNKKKKKKLSNFSTAKSTVWYCFLIRNVKTHNEWHRKWPFLLFFTWTSDVSSLSLCSLAIA